MSFDFFHTVGFFHTFQVLMADREVLQDQVMEVELHNETLLGENEALKLDVQTLQLEREKVRGGGSRANPLFPPHGA